MSSNGVKTNHPVSEQDDRQQNEQEQMARVILRYTEDLRRELNLRLLTEHVDDTADPWHKYLTPERVLYVDSITVTDIRYQNK